LEVVSFCEEEGSRFLGAGMWGSRAVAGLAPSGSADAIPGSDGTSLAAAMRQVGLDPDHISAAARRDIVAFIELHVEQGPILDELALPVGIVAVLSGWREYYVQVVGSANHAGAMPMDLRRDPLAAAAEMVQVIVENALMLGRPAVSTVGKLLVEPGASAVIPERVTFTIDARHSDPAVLERLCALHEQALVNIARRRRVQVGWRITDALSPCACDQRLVQVLERAARDLALPSLTMPSGALHDTQNLAAIAPVAMIFVRSHEGRSHSPAEYSSTEDLVAGTRLLAATLYDCAYA
jgi:allantoate deiminase